MGIPNSKPVNGSLKNQNTINEVQILEGHKDIVRYVVKVNDAM